MHRIMQFFFLDLRTNQRSISGRTGESEMAILQLLHIEVSCQFEWMQTTECGTPLVPQNKYIFATRSRKRAGTFLGLAG